MNGKSLQYSSYKLGAINHVNVSHIISFSKEQSECDRFIERHKKFSHVSLSFKYRSDAGGEASLAILVRTNFEYRVVCEAFNSLIARNKTNKETMTSGDYFLREMWDRADLDVSGSVNVKEIIAVAHSMNINLKESEIRKLFKDYDIEKTGSLTFEEFKSMLDKLRER